MPRINRGAAAAILSVVQERRKESVEREKQLRDWNMKLVELGVKQGLEDRTLEFDFDAQGLWTGRVKKATETQPFDVTSLRPGESVSFGRGGRITGRTLRGPSIQPTTSPTTPPMTPAKIPMLTGTAEESLLSQGTPGAPFPGTIPVSPAGRNTIQAAVNQGFFESPGIETVTPETQPPDTSPGVMNFIRSLLARATPDAMGLRAQINPSQLLPLAEAVTRLVIPGMGLAPFPRQSSAAALLQRTLPRPSPQVPSPQVIRTGVDTATGRRIGQLADGSLIYLDTGEPFVE